MHDYEMLFHTSFFLLSLSLFLTITKPIKQIVSPDKIVTELIVIPMQLHVSTITYTFKILVNNIS